MCRFLMVSSRRPIRPADLLFRFAEMAERSRSLDGDRQVDGWGIAILERITAWRGTWSLRPVWEDQETFENIPAVRRFIVHARSASFPGQKGRLDYNQPYLADGRAFVFNGLLRGVTLRTAVPGDIGAQRIWNLFRTIRPSAPPGRRLSVLLRTLEENSRDISGLNLGLAGGRRMWAFCRASRTGAYYRLQAAESAELRMICSEPLAGCVFHPLPTDRIIAF